jgi:hypothetical protein
VISDEIIESVRKVLDSAYQTRRSFELPNPFYMVFKDGKQLGLTEMDQGNNTLRLLMRDAVAQTADVMGADAFLHVSEAWVNSNPEIMKADVRKDVEGLPQVGPLKDLPGTREIVFIFVGERAGRRRMFTYDIRRDAPEGEPILVQSGVLDSAEHGEAQIISKWDLWDRPSLKREVELR